jgi:site-specific DNA recombinase
VSAATARARFSDHKLAAVSATPRILVRYIRVSAVMGREDEAFRSPKLQLRAIDEAISSAQRMGVHVVGGPVIKDIDRTGTDFNREGIQEAFALKQAGTVHGIACLDVSRIGRTVTETPAAIERFRENGGIFISARENISPTPEGDKMLHDFIAWAEYQSARIAATWQAVIQSRVEEGRHNGSPPVGYTFARDEHGEIIHPRVIVPDDRAAMVVEAFRRYAAGETASSLERELGRRGLFSCGPGKLKPMLSNPFYVGMVRLRVYEGKARKRERVKGVPPFVTDGLHQAILTDAEGRADMALWGEVQARLRREARTAKRLITPRHALAGLIFCAACGKALVHQRGGEYPAGTLQPHYRDPNGRRLGCAGMGTANCEQVEDAVRAEVRQLADDYRVGDADLTAAMRRRADSAAERAALEHRIERLLDGIADADADLYADVPGMTAERHARVTAKLGEQLVAVRARLDALPAVEDVVPVAEVVAAAQAIEQRWDGASPAERNVLLRRAGVVRVTVRYPHRWREPIADRVQVTINV